MRETRVNLAIVMVLSYAPVTLSAADYPIAGTEPSQRPTAAPTIADVDRSGDWYTQALRGITRPYPFSLQFLEDQGDWHTPFNRPGMPGRYDIRGWHEK